jgi:hypothetical protein
VQGATPGGDIIRVTDGAGDVDFSEAAETLHANCLVASEVPWAIAHDIGTRRHPEIDQFLQHDPVIAASHAGSKCLHEGLLPLLPRST